MKRVYIALGILLTCFTLSLFSYFSIVKECKTLITKSEIIIECVNDGEFEKAKEISNDIEALWKKYTFSFSLLTTHYHYDSIEESVDTLNREVKARNREKISESASQLIFNAKHIITTIEPKGENVF